MTIRTLIVDDEQLAREKIRDALAEHDDIEVIGERSDGREALETIRDERPDLVFLDIQMPEMDGFSVLEQLEEDEMPLVVFVTAYDEHALKAFDVHAVDYVLKPFDRERFEAALSKVRNRANSNQNDAEIRRKILEVIDTLPDREKYRDRIVVKSEGRVVFINVDEIDWIEAAGNYARLHVADDAHLIRETMIGLERKLSPKDFVRIHRSAIVNVHRIKEMQPLFHGEYLVVLTSGQQLTLSRGYRDNLQKLLGDAL